MIPIIIAYIAGVSTCPLVWLITVLITNKYKTHNDEDDDSPFNKDGTPKRIIFKSDDV